MKTRYYVTAVGVALAASAGATAVDIGTPVASFNSPGGYANGLAWQETGAGYVWVACGNNRIYQCTTAGSVVRSFGSSHGWTMGLAAGRVGGTWFIWSLGWQPSVVRRFTTTGSPVASFPVAAPGTAHGLAFVDVTHLYEGSYSNRHVYRRHATTGSTYSSFAISSLPTPRDLGYDGRAGDHFWVPAREYLKQGIVYKVDAAGSVITSFGVGQYGDPNGCTFDGEYVWVGFASASGSKVVRFTAGETAVAPCSLGRLKVLCR
jgi:sugar lactone lactonase YvrE